MCSIIEKKIVLISNGWWETTKEVFPGSFYGALRSEFPSPVERPQKCAGSWALGHWSAPGRDFPLPP